MRAGTILLVTCQAVISGSQLQNDCRAAFFASASNRSFDGFESLLLRLSWTLSISHFTDGSFAIARALARSFALNSVLFSMLPVAFFVQTRDFPVASLHGAATQQFTHCGT